MQLHRHTLRESVREVLRALHFRDANSDPASPPPALTDAQLGRLAYALRVHDEHDASLPTLADASGVDARSLHRLAIDRHISSSQLFGLVFVHRIQLARDGNLAWLAASSGSDKGRSGRSIPSSRAHCDLTVTDALLSECRAAAPTHADSKACTDAATRPTPFDRCGRWVYREDIANAANATNGDARLADALDWLSTSDALVAESPPLAAPSSAPVRFAVPREVARQTWLSASEPPAASPTALHCFRFEHRQSPIPKRWTTVERIQLRAVLRITLPLTNYFADRLAALIDDGPSGPSVPTWAAAALLRERVERSLPELAVERAVSFSQTHIRMKRGIALPTEAERAAMARALATHPSRLLDLATAAWLAYLEPHQAAELVALQQLPVFAHREYCFVEPTSFAAAVRAARVSDANGRERPRFEPVALLTKPAAP
jgi:hypothetical protein